MIFYKNKPEEKNIIFETIGNEIGIPASAVEKDWWVVQTLALIQALEAAPHIVFKGGTSLSKCLIRNNVYIYKNKKYA